MTTSNLVVQLRQFQQRHQLFSHGQLAGEAADEIERLRALLTRVYEWTPAFPVEAGLLDEIGVAIGYISTADEPAAGTAEGL